MPWTIGLNHGNLQRILKDGCTMYKYELNLIESYRDGKAEGMSIGEAKGEANATNRMVKSLKEQGVPIEVIAKAANLR